MRTRCRIIRSINQSYSVTHLVRRSSLLALKSSAGSDLGRKYEGNWKRGLAVAASSEPTIYALSTAPGRAAIAIIRISGPACLTVYEALCPGKPPPKPRYATLRTIHEPSSDGNETSVLDSGALVLHFPAPETATGEDVLEFHVHGGTAVVKAVLAAIPRAVRDRSVHSIRYAEPGEFTRRAFYNDRLDLLQIEALGDTLSAETEQQRRLAVRGRGTAGSLTKYYESWRELLLLARGELEALIDFSEDQHFDESPTQLCASVAIQVQQLRSQLRANIKSAARGELLRNGINIALVGAPNAGKSSLLNQIVGREAAIVSSEAGTTRDVVDVNVDIGGFFCKFGDLAGLRKQLRPRGGQAIGEIEQEGIRRAKERALIANVVIAVLPTCVMEGPQGPIVSVEVEAEVAEVLKRCDTDKQKIVFVLTKTDLVPSHGLLSEVLGQYGQDELLKDCMDPLDATVYPISCKNAQENGSNNPDTGGIQSLLRGLTRLFGRMTAAVHPENQHGNTSNQAWAESLGASERQRVLLQQCLDHLEKFLIEVKFSEKHEGLRPKQEEEVDVVLAAESLRSAAGCLSKITGKGEAGDVEEVLGVVFEKFCVGK